MNGFAAPDTAAGICSAAIKRGFAAPSPDFPAHNFIFSESNLRKILDSTDFHSAICMYAWTFIFRLCYMWQSYSKELLTFQETMYEKINKIFREIEVNI